MNSVIITAFSGVVAVILLGLYSGSTFYMESLVVRHCGQIKDGPCLPHPGLVGDGFIYVVTTVSGLISALVIAKLSVTEPGQAPTVGSYVPASRFAEIMVGLVVGLYLLAWAATGLSALVVGVMLYPKVIGTLGDLGTSWLGLAVSATYAYFGLSPRAARDAVQANLTQKLLMLRSGSDRTVQFSLDQQTAAGLLSPSDLVLHQHVPSTSEGAACGAATNPVKRGTPEFAALVKNINPAIEFKNEEGTGADRMMTPRLLEKLDVLAVAVGKEWPGLRLRVTEAWDEDQEHAGGASLHYEGRAADVTVSSKEAAKLGRLGRLAVDAGLDWVFYEDQAHVHVSVRR